MLSCLIATIILGGGLAGALPNALNANSVDRRESVCVTAICAFGLGVLAALAFHWLAGR